MINVAWKFESTKTAPKMVVDTPLYAERQGLYIILAAVSPWLKLVHALLLKQQEEGKLGYLKSPPTDSW